MGILVFPAASRPNINILMSFFPNSFASTFPILTSESLSLRLGLYIDDDGASHTNTSQRCLFGYEYVRVRMLVLRLYNLYCFWWREREREKDGGMYVYGERERGKGPVIECQCAVYLLFY